MIEVRGRITEAGKLEITLPAGVPPGDVTVRIEASSPETAWTDEELQVLKNAAPKTFQELATWLASAPPTEAWGGLHDDESAADYIHNARHKAAE